MMNELERWAILLKQYQKSLKDASLKEAVVTDKLN